MTAPRTDTSAGGGTNNNDRSSRRERGDRPYASAEEIARQVAQIISRNGNDPQRAVTDLMNDNRRLRDKLRAAKEENAELGKKTPDGSVVLTGDDAKAWEKWKALGVKPDEAKTRIELATKLESEKQQVEKNKTFAEAAKALGYNEQVFTDLVNDKKLHIELRDVEKDGKVAKAPYIRLAANEKDPLLPAKEYVEKELKGYVPSLTAPAQGATSGTSFPAQSGGTSTASPSGTAASPATQQQNGQQQGPNLIPGQSRFLSPSEARKAAQ